jgi:hypothetical protein
MQLPPSTYHYYMKSGAGDTLSTAGRDQHRNLETQGKNIKVLRQLKDGGPLKTLQRHHPYDSAVVHDGCSEEVVGLQCYLCNSSAPRDETRRKRSLNGI